MSADDDELLQVFLEEVHEHLDGIEGDLLSIESRAPALDQELVNKITRAVHSVKGGAGFFGLDNIKNLSHAMETVLALMQRGRLRPSRANAGLLLRSADLLVAMVNAPERSQEQDIGPLVTELGAVQPDVAEEARVEPSAAAATATDSAPAQLGSPAPRAPPDRVPSAVTSNGAVAPKSPSPSGGGETSIRVQLAVLDRLMTLAGELVLTRNQLMQSHGTDEYKHAEATQRIDHITTELQDAIMSTRMQSIGVVFQKFRRVVRDLARVLDKEVELVLEGEEVELDRTIVEAIGDPLMHMVRNAMDHGIEAPDVRVERGKSRQGRVRLGAFHKAGQVIVEIEDDGAGIDPQRVRTKAIERGVCSHEQLTTMSDAAVTRLIFRPGFSTASEVTDISGRGVGMDVAHANLSRIGGVIDVQSNVGAGTLMRVKLPLTLAIIPSLLVGEESEAFAIPQANLVELHRIAAANVKTSIHRVRGALVLRLRGELIPLVRLRDALSLPGRTFEKDGERLPDRRETGVDRRQESAAVADERRRGDDRRHAGGSAVNVAIVAAGDFRYGLIVESLQDSLEIVVKPLGRHLRRCSSYAGATILGDGRLALILDVVSIGRRMQAGDASDAIAAEHAGRVGNGAMSESLALLLVESSGEETLAVPLGLVERIERIAFSDVQNVGGKRTLAYRGRSLALLMVDDVVPVAPIRAGERAFVIVFRNDDREVGLLVSRLVDIVDVSAEIDEVTHRQPGVFGSLLVDDRVTLLLDVQQIARTKFGIAAPAAAAKVRQKRGVLVVDDSRFFRDRIAEFVTELGYDVFTAEDGVDALECLERHSENVHLVLTDIEMPRLDGFGLTQRLRNDARFSALPIVAITSLLGDEFEQRGKSVGLDAYLIKLDRDGILQSVEHHLNVGRTGVDRTGSAA